MKSKTKKEIEKKILEYECEMFSNSKVSISNLKIGKEYAVCDMKTVRGKLVNEYIQCKYLITWLFNDYR